MRKNRLSYKTTYKLFLAMILAINFTIVSTVLAQDQLVKSEKVPKIISGKCWKKVWISSEALMGKNTMPVCKAFEEVLKTTCEPPEKLRCKWTLPTGEKRFRKLQWQPLDPKDHWGLIRDICLSGWLEKYRAGQWEHYEPEYKKDLAEGRLKLFTAKVDVDHDGKVEDVVRLNRRPDCPSLSEYGVMHSRKKQIDWKYANLFNGHEIILYNGSAYMFLWEDVPGRIMIYEGYILTEMGTTGAINICQYQYLKTGKKKLDSRSGRE